MFNLGFSELLIIGAIALIFIGPKELPEIARVIGRMLNEFKRATGDLHSTLMAPQEHLKSEFKKILDDHPGDQIPTPSETGDLPDLGFEPVAQKVEEKNQEGAESKNADDDKKESV